MLKKMKIDIKLVKERSFIELKSDRDHRHATWTKVHWKGDEGGMPRRGILVNNKNLLF
jgi:hypothetical protein